MDGVTRTESAPGKQFRTLRHHNKSRLGCISCKKRKVKCDEARPICGTCKLRKTECAYPSRWANESSTVVSLVRRSKANNLTNPAFNDEAAAYDVSNSINTLHIDPLSSSHSAPIDYIDMKVMWFYTSATCKSLTVATGDQEIFQDTLQNAVVRSAFESQFLMKTLLALASVHMQSLGQKIDARRCLSYCSKAFEGHRKAINEADPESHAALLTNALLLALLSSPALRSPGEARLLLIDWMLMWRGIPSVFKITGFECLKSSGLDPLFLRPTVPSNATSAAVPGELQEMLSRVQADEEDFASLPAYRETLRCLGSLYHHLSGHGVDYEMLLRIVTFFTVVPNQFVVLARTQQPRAMVILAHYAAFLKLVSSFWWLGNAGDSSIVDIWQHTRSHWHEYMQLPLAVMVLTEQNDILQLLLSQSSPSLKLEVYR